MKNNNDLKHNITKLIEKHAHNKEFLQTLLEDVDFSEITSKNIKYEYSFDNLQTDEINYPSISYENKEQSLAVNCILNLPLNNYENFITPDWINFVDNKKDRIVPIVLGAKKYDFLNEMLKISTKHLFSLEQESEEYQNYHEAYESNLLSPILNIGKHIFDLNLSGYGTEKNYEQYYQLFKNALECFNDYLPRIYKRTYKEGFIPEHDIIKDSNWLDHYSKFNYVVSKKMDKNELCSELIKNSKSYCIYLELFPQLEKDIEFKTVFNLKKAINFGNIPVIMHLSKELKFSQEKINEINNKDLNTLINNFKNKYNEKKGSLEFNHHYENYVVFMNKFYRFLTNEQFDCALADSSLLPAFIVLDSNSINCLSEKYSQLKTGTIVQDLNLQECAYANSSFYNFIEQSGLKLTNGGNLGKPTSYDLLLIHKAAKYYKTLNPQFNFNNIDSKRKNEIEKIVANLYFDMVKFNDDKEKNSTISVYILENKVVHKDNKNTSNSKLKI